MNHAPPLPWLAALAAAAAAPCPADWPAFRGDGSSSSLTASPPAEWSVDEGRNVAWKAALPGRGVSGPIVVADRVIVTASDGPNHERLHVLALDAATGARLWSRQVWATGRTARHDTSAVAAPTPASDGERVFAFYSSNDLVAIGLEGDVHWVRGLALDHPGVGNDIGMASSPVVAGDSVVVQAECQGESFALAVDRRTGRTLWEVERRKESNWASPLAWTTPDGEPAVWLQDGAGATLYDAATGEVLRQIPIGCSGIPSLAPAGDGRLVLPAAGVSVFAAPFEEPLRQIGGLQPGTASPVVVEDRVLVVNSGGVLACADLASGDILWRRRLGGQVWATPVVADGRVYCVGLKGEATVVDLQNGTVLSKADFGEEANGSPAVAGRAIYFRTAGHLWKIAAVEQAAAPRPASATR